MKIIKFQPAPRTDDLTTEGEELTQLPWAFMAAENGELLGPPGFHRIVGFAARPEEQKIALEWADMTDPQQTVGMYLVTEDKRGEWGTHLTAIAEAGERV